MKDKGIILNVYFYFYEGRYIMNLPKDPFMLLSIVNMQLRDFYPNLDEFCADKDVDKQEIIDIIAKVKYEYNEELNQFKPVV